ncbi:MAG: anti-sigma factor antagonist [Actinomycetota bacterium]|jgi:anti-anti-sigma factor|nr:anti-sigma factor antagonist [Actinomycetota bacterium]
MGAGCEVRVSVDDDGGIVLHVVGELDLATVSVLRDALSSLPQIGARRVVLDVSELAFISAAGVRVALEAQRQLARDGGQLVLRGPSALLMRVLQATEVDQEFEIDKRRDGTPAGWTG